MIVYLCKSKSKNKSEGASDRIGPGDSYDFLSLWVAWWVGGLFYLVHGHSLRIIIDFGEKGGGRGLVLSGLCDVISRGV